MLLPEVTSQSCRRLPRPTMGNSKYPKEIFVANLEKYTFPRVKLQLHEKKEQPQSLLGDSETGEIHLMNICRCIACLDPAHLVA